MTVVRSRRKREQKQFSETKKLTFKFIQEKSEKIDKCAKITNEYLNILIDKELHLVNIYENEDIDDQ
jgi:uncharacterized FlaG/YvyC family protein